MFSDTQINHRAYKEDKKEESIKEIGIKIEEKPVKIEKKYDATDVNKDGVTNLKDAVSVVGKIIKKGKK